MAGSEAGRMVSGLFIVQVLEEPPDNLSIIILDPQNVLFYLFQSQDARWPAPRMGTIVSPAASRESVSPAASGGASPAASLHMPAEKEYRNVGTNESQGWFSPFDKILIVVPFSLPEIGQYQLFSE